MKVKIGGYKYYYGPYQISNLLKYVGVGEEGRDAFGDWLADGWIGKFCYWIDSKRKREVKVRIDPWDTWSMDHTLAYIVLPMLKQLKETKHGSPYVDQEDLPEELRMTERELKVFNDGHWDKSLNATKEEQDIAHDKFFAQFDWIMDQMIWSFEQQIDEDEGEKNYYDPYESEEELDADCKEEIVWHEDGTMTKTPPLLDKEWRREHGKINMEKYKAYHKKKQFGFTMFGKYYQSLWD